MLNNLTNNIELIFEEYTIDNHKIKKYLDSGEIKLFKSKYEFVFNFSEIDKEDLLDYILKYDHINDDFVQVTLDIAITYLEDKRFIYTKYSLHELEIPFEGYNYVYISSENVLNDILSV